MGKKMNETGVGAIAGFQVPLGIKKRKKKVDEMLSLNEQVSITETLAYFGGLDEATSKIVEGLLDEMEYVKLAEMIKQGYAENALRQLVRSRVREIVRKQDDGKYALYAPNPGKAKGSKKVGEFPTRAAARRSELQRFPPKDPEKLQQRRKEVEKMRKDPSLATKTDSGKKPKKKKESIERIVKAITESLFREERKGSDWDEYVSRLSKQAVLADKTFQGHQKNIAKKSEAALKNAVKEIESALGSKGFEVSSGGVKKDQDKGRVYTEVEAADQEGVAKVGPIYVFVENGESKIEISDGARVGLTKLEPERSKLLRAELMAVQEDVLAGDDTVSKAVQKRDDYLNKIERKVDNTVANMSALEITMLKNVLVKKYRKIS